MLTRAFFNIILVPIIEAILIDIQIGKNSQIIRYDINPSNLYDENKLNLIESQFKDCKTPILQLF